MTTVKCNSFVMRQTKDSSFSYFDGTWEALEDRVLQNFANYTPGYKEGVRLISVPANGFFSGIVAITPETELIAKFAPRREGEEAFISIHARGQKLPAKHVDIVVYSKAVLAENNENSTSADWEIVSINARITDEPTPMDPITMMRNQLHLAGGTKGEFSGDDFAKSIYFWSKHANCL